MLVRPEARCVIVHDKNDAVLVGKAAQLFADDVKRVTGKTIKVEPSPAKLSENSVVIGSIGSSSRIDRWISEGRLDVSAIRGKWECYLIQVLRNPEPGVERALVIVGSDRRGTAYGVFDVSERIGVSPWYWWADVPCKKRDELVLEIKRAVSRPPSVKYRGIFINDEDWGLLRWAKMTFEPERKNIGPKTYEKVCELLLRLKANYLCPAMHEASTAFNKIPENKVIADTYGIVMGSVHCEPLLFNNASEWDRKTMGEWDFVKNRDAINRVLRRRVEENGKYENVYTLALRGLHDRAMSGSNNMAERVRIMQGALADQRQILSDELKRPLTEIPQAFTPYKEVLDVYSSGLQLPDDVTIVWPDDNYGYMKRLSNPGEQKRSGRSGVYYHVSYLGKPHDYLWMASTPPALMFSELRKAYDTTADRIWLLNVGDIKSCESAMTLFLEMAYDINAFNYENIDSWNARWLASMFGKKYYKDLFDITTTFYRLAFARRPELMGWGYEWNSNQHPSERTTDTDFSFTNYREAERRLADCDRMARLAERLMLELPEDAKPAFFQLVYHPIRGAELMNKMHLTAQKNRWYAAQGRAATNSLRDEAKQCHDGLVAITKQYNELLGGKWNGIMSLRMGGPTSYYKQPPTDSLTLPERESFGIQVEGGDAPLGSRSYHALPSFNPFLKRSYYFDIYNKSAQPIDWSLSTSAPWIVIDKTRGRTAAEERVHVSIDWGVVPRGDDVLGAVNISAGGEIKQVLVSVFNPRVPSLDEIAGLYVEDNGCVSIPAAGFHRKTENAKVKMRIIPNLGFEDVSVQLGDPTAPRHGAANLKSPGLEYDFYTFHHGSVDVYTYALPTFPLYSDTGFAGHESTNIQTRFGICIDNGAVLTPTSSSFEYAKDWYENVLRNCAIKKTTLHISKPGRHTLRVICGDPGIVLQKIVIDLGGMKRAYMGPPSTRVEINTPSPVTYKNPLAVKFGDPFVLKASNGKYYMYGTTDHEKGFRACVSDDLLHWKELGRVYEGALPGSWTVKDFWAPEVYEIDGKYYMLFSADWKDNPNNEKENFRIGVAVADRPEGPFRDLMNRPIFDPGYPIIDANLYFEGGRVYLYYSRCCYKNPVASEISDWARRNGYFEEIEESWVYGVEIKPDFSGIIGSPKLLLRPPERLDDKQAEWESRSVTSREVNRRWTEGSFIFKKNGTYYMMYSANYYGGQNYAVGYATSDNPLGPFKKADNNPVLQKNTNTGGDVTGTGHNMVFTHANGTLYCVYHGRTKKSRERVVFIDRMEILPDGKLIVHGPTTTEQAIKSSARE
ncbi:glycosyl hydrolase 115 family protein [Ereboglobus sp. PH5-5]|uniref:glycosyl hydrolase 115 family protein n=1 Tax=Ereboglobus sp. PH5-5 TaxID=2940529 RepID=UPI0024075BB0|nr:glycosyl hydrolase 115 family protein [Ereboglobus sp. PH5-5]